MNENQHKRNQAREFEWLNEKKKRKKLGKKIKKLLTKKAKKVMLSGDTFLWAHAGLCVGEWMTGLVERCATNW